MVVRLHRRVSSEQCTEVGSLLEQDVVVGELSRRVLVPVVPDVVRQVLDPHMATGDADSNSRSKQGQQGVRVTSGRCTR